MQNAISNRECALPGACSEQVEQHAVCLYCIVNVHLLLCNNGTSIHGFDSVQQTDAAFGNSILQQRQHLPTSPMSSFGVSLPFMCHSFAAYKQYAWFV